MSSVEDHQGDSNQAPACFNAGNPVFSCMISENTTTSPARQGFSPWFKTTSSEYGALRPTSESSPCTYHPLTQTFSRDLGKCGMYRDNCFNTSLDRSRAHD
ncbi:unnamed protein product [Boreogadus saida]